MNDVEINESNFHEYFSDARTTKPKQGQILAKYVAVADFIEGDHKQHVIDLLKKGRVTESVQVLTRIHGAKVPWCYKVLRDMCEDLLKYSTPYVEKNPYEMVVEYLFWANPEHVPKNDQHWQTLNVIEYDSETNEYRSKIEI